MKRDWDKIREILIKIEEQAPGDRPVSLGDFPTDKAYEYSLHAELLIEAGLVYGKMSKTLGMQANSFSAIRLTWQGYEFLDAIRNDTIWEKTKKCFADSGLSMTFDLAKETAKTLIVPIVAATIS